MRATLVALGLVLAPLSSLLTLALAATRWPAMTTGYGSLAPLVAVLLAGSALVGLGLLWARLAARSRNHQPAPIGVPLRLGAYAILLGGAAHLLVMPEGDSIYFLVSLALTATAWPLAVLGEPLARRMIPARVWRGIDLLLANLVFVAIGLEAGLRVVSWVRPSPIFVGAYTPAENVARARRAAGTYYYGHPLDDRSFHDARQPQGSDTKLVVSIADSFALSVPLPYHFTTVCERHLPGVEVYNMGLPGIGPPEYLQILREDALAARPAAVVLNLFVGNDIAEWCESDPPGFFFGRRNLLLYLVPLRLIRLAREAERTGSVWRRAEAFRVKRRLTRAELLEEYPWLETPGLEPPTFSLETWLEIETRRIRRICGEPPGCLDRVREILAAMQKEARGTPLLVTIIPDEAQVEDPLWAELQARLPGVPLDRELPQRKLRALLSELQIPHLDLLPALRALPAGEDGWRHCYRVRDTHLNTRGNRVIGEALAEALPDLLNDQPRSSASGTP